VSEAFVIAAGGTGGHLFPARALAAALIRRGHIVHLATDRRGAGYEAMFTGVSVHRLPAGAPVGPAWRKAAGIAELALGAIAARRLLGRIQPRVVVGFGGYPSLPAMVAAGWMRLPTLIHEQNAVLGRANRWLAPRVRTIAAGLPIAGQAVEVVGNPVRPEVLALATRPYPMAEAGPLRLVVLGGSQGARTLGRMVPVALGLLSEELRWRLRVSQQARPEDVEEAKRMYAESAIRAEVSPFFGDAPGRLAEAHLAITRAGASTLAELGVLGRPAILVPYPRAMDDHQSANAATHAASGAAEVLPESSLTPERLASRVAALLGDPSGLMKRARAAANQGRPDAVERLADLVEGLARRALVASSQIAGSFAA
jgi:UDP-N-acetylglucosamine--N-acetylmuramyl-(pentapeptide) pyrophosphoryl-undecaprenol N-acetylglucosamine transferase